MENASKGLLMAGGVLLAVIIISLFVRTYSSIGQFQRQQLSQEEAQQIEAFNKDYTKYAGQYVYGTEVITIINRVANYQTKNPGAAFEVDVQFLSSYTYTLSNGKKRTTKGVLQLKGTGDKYSFIDDSTPASKENIKDLTNRAFLCTGVQNDAATGRVNKITFKEVKITG